MPTFFQKSIVRSGRFIFTCVKFWVFIDCRVCMKTVFELIIEGKLPCTKVFENERVLAIEDIRPLAPVHVLIIPKKHFRSIHEVGPDDAALMGEIILVAQEVAKIKGVEENYRLLTNHGPDSGQTVFHLHFHLLGGKVLTHMI